MTARDLRIAVPPAPPVEANTLWPSAPVAAVAPPLAVVAGRSGEARVGAEVDPAVEEKAVAGEPGPRESTQVAEPEAEAEDTGPVFGSWSTVAV